ncbi:hypothetical protein Tsubulata_014105 [Turnera subulata]|uniref:Tetrapyrrole biosynthesis uroporphyrinogen III synthase domain-containing protein n=1 Tax=Turnera subulata TaxID=218843 RepID=A0A9Q0GBP1_9ROSI|nr:hypothetical protein Tsubulata_014105 [Turnera subulata]
MTTIPTTASPAVAFTTPPNYAARLSHFLALKSLTPLWCPTITTQTTPETLSSLSLHLSPPSLSLLSAIAFPSRTAISALSAALSSSTHLLPPRDDIFILAALGKDAELLDRNFLLKFCGGGDDGNCIDSRVRILVPEVASPSGLVKALGDGRGRKVLCPVPRVVGLEEPPVVPNFLGELEATGWVPIRVDAYETRWLGPTCAEGIVRRSEEGGMVDAIVFTSSGEVEGLLKSLKELGWDWKMVRRRWPGLVVAAHGPVTAEGAERLGVDVDVVSGRFESFHGVVDAVNSKLRGFELR